MEKEIMKHIVSFSGGVSSSVTAHRVIEKYGKDSVSLWFADTSWEDEDLYRFNNEIVEFLGVNLITYRDGRTPLQVCEDVRLIGNQKRAPCTRSLKIEPFVKFIKEQTKTGAITVHIGMSWEETHRMDAPRKNYESINGVSVEFPLMWQPWLTSREMFSLVNSWGIDIPRLYGMGMPHNNCGGRCIKQGISHWLNLKKKFPERFNEVRDWEQFMRNDMGINYAIARDQRSGEVRPRTLVDIENDASSSESGQIDMFDDASDMYYCHCT